MRRVITIFALTTAVLALIIGSGAWITGQWYCLDGQLGGIHYWTSYGDITIQKYGEFQGPRFTSREPIIKRPLWHDELTRPRFDSSPPWQLVLPYWLILAFSLATGGLGLWLARKRPHRYQGFQVQAAKATMVLALIITLAIQALASYDGIRIVPAVPDAGPGPTVVRDSL